MLGGVTSSRCQHPLFCIGCPNCDTFLLRWLHNTSYGSCACPFAVCIAVTSWLIPSEIQMTQQDRNMLRYFLRTVRSLTLLLTPWRRNTHCISESWSWSMPQHADPMSSLSSFELQAALARPGTFTTPGSSILTKTSRVWWDAGLSRHILHASHSAQE